VEQVTQELADVRSYQITVEPGSFRFTPGQFVVLGLPEFSLEGALAVSSSPYERESFSVTVKRSGSFGTAFYDHVQDGSPVLIGKPSGLCCIAEVGHRPVCFIGRDASITPSRSFARFFAMEATRRRFTLIHELSSHTQRLFEMEFQQPTYSWMRRSLYLDCADTPAHWSGNLGAVNTFAVLNEVPDFLETEFYVAGDSKDIRRVRGILRELNIPLQQIHTEKWTF
jgi:ferredoxin-NADP reductase